MNSPGLFVSLAIERFVHVVPPNLYYSCNGIITKKQIGEKRAFHMYSTELSGANGPPHNGKKTIVFFDCFSIYAWSIRPEEIGKGQRRPLSEYTRLRILTVKACSLLTDSSYRKWTACKQVCQRGVITRPQVWKGLKKCLEENVKKDKERLEWVAYFLLNKQNLESWPIG